MHSFILAVMHKLIGVPTLHPGPLAAAALSAVLVVLPLVLLAAWPTWMLVERPFLSLRGSYLRTDPR